MERFIVDLGSEYISYLGKLKEVHDQSLKDYKEFLNHPFISWVSFNTPQCNLDCDYCYSKDFHEIEPFDVNKFKRKILLASETFEFSDLINITPTHLGEPLLYQNKYLELFAFFESVMKQSTFKYYILTNGTVPLNKSFLDFIAKRQVNMQVSFDFFPNLNDRHRKFSNGSPTSSKVLSFLDNLRSANIPFNLRMTLSEYSVQLFLRAFDFILKNFTERIDVNLMFPELNLGCVNQGETAEREKAIEHYLFFYVLNRVLFHLDNLNFILLKPGYRFCYYRQNLVFVPGTDYISGCHASFDERAYYAKYQDNSLRLLNRNFLDLSLKDLPETCSNCPFVDFCGSKGCIKVKEENLCRIKPFFRRAILSKIEEKYRVYPLFEENVSEIRLIHYFKTLRFLPLSEKQKSSFLSTADFQELFDFVMNYKSMDFKVVLFHNFQELSVSRLLKLSKLLDSRNLFVCFVRALNQASLIGINPKDLSYHLIIPEEKRDNLDFIKYSRSTQMVHVGNNSFPFSIRENLFDRVNYYLS